MNADRDVEPSGSEAPILVQRPEDGVAWVTLNRPAARNAVNGALALALGAAVRDVEADPTVSVAVLAGAGKGFCAGADLSVVAAGGEAALWTPDGGFAGFVTAPRAKVWIAAVRGFALAGGLEIMLACDLVVASTDAVFGLPEVKRGLLAGAGGLIRLPRAIPRAVALEMIVTGEAIRADRAAALGLVNRTVPPDEVDAQALAMARLVAGNAPRAVHESLAIARDAHEDGGADLVRRSKEALARLASGEDIREGALAFLEKRPPRWSGR